MFPSISCENVVYFLNDNVKKIKKNVAVSIMENFKNECRLLKKENNDKESSETKENTNAVIFGAACLKMLDHVE